MSISDDGMGLQIRGLISDEVVDLDAGLPGPTAATSELTTAEVQGALNWLRSTLVFIRSWLPSNSSETQSAEGLLAKLLTLNKSWAGFQEDFVELEDFVARNPDPATMIPESILRFVNRLFTSTEFNTTSTYTTGGHQRWVYQPIPQRIISTLGGRRIFVTKELRIGISKSALEVGDKVVIFAGGKMPFILRPHLGDYKLIGYAYIEGMSNCPPTGQDFERQATNLTIL